MTDIKMTVPTYLDEDTYRRLVGALLHVEPDIASGEVDANGIKLVLAEIGNIFPAHIRRDDPDELPGHNIARRFLDGYRSDMEAMAARSVF